MRITTLLPGGCSAAYLLTWAGRGYGKFAGLMDGDELLALDKEVLVDLIMRLHERVAASATRANRSLTGR
jgi:hypothetical protein